MKRWISRYTAIGYITELLNICTINISARNYTVLINIAEQIGFPETHNEPN